MSERITMDIWQELYDNAVAVKTEEPWKSLCNLDIIAIELKEMEEPIFCVVQGYGDLCYGVNAYVGYRGFKDFLFIIESERYGMPPEYAMFEQNSISMFLGDRNELTEGERKIIREVGHKFRGKNQWIYFESYKKGYVPDKINKEEAILLSKVLKELVIILRDFKEGKIKVNFDQGEMLLRKFDEDGNYINTKAKLPFYENEYYLLVINDEVLKQRMKKQPQVDISLEMDMVYLNTAINDEKSHRNINAKIALIMEHNNGMVLGQQLMNPHDDEENILLNMFIGFIMQNGRPKEVVVRNPFIGSILYDICQECDIILINADLLNATNEFVYGMARFKI